MGSNVEMGKTVDGLSVRIAHTLFKCSRMGVESIVTHLHVGGGARHEVAPGKNLLTPCVRFEILVLIPVLSTAISSVRESALVYQIAKASGARVTPTSWVWL